MRSLLADVFCFSLSAYSELDPTMLIEKNRLKTGFKNAFCGNVDQFFDVSDACKVYGTEIFNLLEPLFNYLIENLNPEFNFQKLQQLHSQNMTLSCALPFVTSCEHAKNCVECHNLLLAGMSRSRVKMANKTTQTDAMTSNDTPLSKIVAGLDDIEKGMLSLVLPTAKPTVETKSVQCQTSERRSEKSHSSHSSRSHRHSERKDSKDKHSDSKSKEKHETRKHASSSSRRHSRSDHHSSRSSRSTHVPEKRRKTNDSETTESSENEHSARKRRRSSTKSEDSRKKKRPSSEKSGDVDKKKLKTESKAVSNVEVNHRKSSSESESGE